MRLPKAEKTPGRYSVLLMRTGDETSSVLYIPNAKLKPCGKPEAAINAEGGQLLALPEGGARFVIGAWELKRARALYDFAHRAFALGRLNLLESAFTTAVILRDVWEDVDGLREYMAVKYTGCALMPLGGNKWELHLRAPGTLGTVSGENYIDLDECFEEGWPRDD